MIQQRIDIWKGLPYDETPNPGFRPHLDTYVLDGNKQRGAVLILPGGGYCMTSEREAEPVAMRFAAAGFHAFVLWYSVAPHRHPQPLRDVSRALNILRENAESWQLDDDRIAVAGFSAGGHLAASIGVHWNKDWLSGEPGLLAGANQPNALVLSYPVITSGAHAHRGSFDNLLGPEPDPSLLKLMSAEQGVGPHTPPTFLWHTFDDGAVPVENSMLFAGALRKAGIPFELHVFPSGVHGLSLAEPETSWDGIGIDSHVAGWMRLCTEWISERFK